MTYAELIRILQSLPAARLQDTVTVYVPSEDEFYGVDHGMVADASNDVLDAGHLYLTL